MKIISGNVTKNTLMLFFRQILILAVNLFTVRIVLQILGKVDYGIYNVVAGVVTSLGFLTNSMALASQRYFSIDIASGDDEKLNRTFIVTMLIYLTLGIIVILIAETIGLWFVNSKLNIDIVRMNAANLIYQFAVISFLMSVFVAPFMAMIIAHEDMSAYAYISIFEAIGKLGLTFLLSIISYDKLIIYGLLQMFLSAMVFLLYSGYSFRKYNALKIKYYSDLGLFKEIWSFSFWNMIGSCVGVVKNQITNIMLNIFFGPIINTSRALALQIYIAVTSFAQNFTTAMRPVVIKEYSQGNKNVAFDNVMLGCRITFYLMYIIILPLVIEMKFVLQFWLGNLPEHVVIFTQLILIDALIDSLGYQIMTLAQATGKIRGYQIVVGSVLLLNLPISYLLIRNGASPVAVFIVSIVLTVFAAVIRLIVLKIISGFLIMEFMKNVIFPCLVIVGLSLPIPISLSIYMNEGFTNFIFIFLVCEVEIILGVWLFGLSHAEKLAIKGAIKKGRR